MATEKLFKKELDLSNAKDYAQFIEDSIKPLGFSTELDEAFFEMKLKLFTLLRQHVTDSGPSFDPEIFFSSLVDDLKDTYDAVGATLLQLQRMNEQ